jgi:hypothetical protein
MSHPLSNLDQFKLLLFVKASTFTQISGDWVQSLESPVAVVSYWMQVAEQRARTATDLAEAASCRAEVDEYRALLVADPVEAVRYRAKATQHRVRAAQCRAEAVTDDLTMAEAYFAQVEEGWAQVEEYRALAAPGFDEVEEHCARAEDSWSKAEERRFQIRDKVHSLRVSEYPTFAAKHLVEAAKYWSQAARIEQAVAGPIKAVEWQIGTIAYLMQISAYFRQAAEAWNVRNPVKVAGYLFQATSAFTEAANCQEKVAEAERAANHPVEVARCQAQMMEYLLQAAKYFILTAEAWDMVDFAEASKFRAQAAESRAMAADSRAQAVTDPAMAALWQAKVATEKSQAALHLVRAYEYYIQVEDDPMNIAHCRKVVTAKIDEATNYRIEAVEHKAKANHIMRAKTAVPQDEVATHQVPAPTANSHFTEGKNDVAGLKDLQRHSTTGTI